MKNLVFTFCLLSMGCVTSRQVKSARHDADSSSGKAATGHAKSVKVDQSQDHRDIDLLLKRKSQLAGLGITANPQQKGAVNMRPMKNWGPELSGLTEDELFTRLTSAYEKNDEFAFTSILNTFLGKYPQSSRADDALYMGGLSAISSHNSGLALRYLNQILQSYPYSDKVASAMFAKATIYRKMDLSSYSKNILNELVARYPQSPEANRAQMELRLIK